MDPCSGTPSRSIEETLLQIGSAISHSLCDQGWPALPRWHPVAAQATVQIALLRISYPRCTIDISDLFHQPAILPILPPMLHGVEPFDLYACVVAM